MSGIPDGADDDPHPDDYEPREVVADVEATKDLLLWARREGITMQVLTIGRVQLTHVEDHFPRKSVQAAIARAAAAGPVERDADDAVDDFATAEERAILRDGE